MRRGGRSQVSRPRLVRAFAAPAVTGSLAATLPLVTGTAVTLTGGGSTAPIPSGTIIFDTRAGGAHDWQTQATLAGLHSVWSYGDTTNGTAVASFASNCDGAGAKGRRIDWSGGPSVEQRSMLLLYHSAGSSATNGMYWQWKVKYASNFAYNSNGQGAKVWLGYRTNDNATDRLYLVEQSVSPGVKVASDSRGWSTSVYPPGPPTDTVVTYTLFIHPSTGVVKFWHDGTLTVDLTGQNCGTGGFVETQFNVASYIQTTTYQYNWDYVIWVP